MAASTKQSLTITDNRTGKNYEVPVADGTIRATDLRQIKTDDKDLAAIHRATTTGFALTEPPRDLSWQTLQLLARHRRDLVHKTSLLACQIREHLVHPGTARETHAQRLLGILAGELDPACGDSTRGATHLEAAPEPLAQLRLERRSFLHTGAEQHFEFAAKTIGVAASDPDRKLATAVETVACLPLLLNETQLGLCSAFRSTWTAAKAPGLSRPVHSRVTWASSPNCRSLSGMNGCQPSPLSAI